MKPKGTPRQMRSPGSLPRRCSVSATLSPLEAGVDFRALVEELRKLPLRPPAVREKSEEKNDGKSHKLAKIAKKRS